MHISDVMRNLLYEPDSVYESKFHGYHAKNKSGRLAIYEIATSLEVENTDEILNLRWFKIKEVEVVMEKLDLKTGHIVQLRNGNTMIVMLNTGPNNYNGLYEIGTGKNISLNSYHYDLSYININNEFDIIKIFEVDYLGDFFSSKKDLNMRLIWERKKPKYMTKEDIEKELGYKISIVPF